MNEQIAARIRESLDDGVLNCPIAFKIARQLEVTPLEVGQTATEMEIHLAKCQLGLFGYGPKEEGKHRIVEPAAEVSAEMRAKIEAGLVDDRLPCATAWEIARELKVKRMAVSSACETLGVRIKPCQLGCF